MTRRRIGTRALRLWSVLVVLGLVAPTEAARPRRYELDVRLDAARRHVSVEGTVSVQLDEGQSSFTFGLHETFRIAKCTIDGEPARCARAESGSPGTGEGGREVTVEWPAAAEGTVVLEIRYDGAILNRPGWGEPDAEGPFMDDSAGPDRVELALYSNWYPVFGFGPVFDVELDLTTPRGWAVACIGQEVERREGEEETTTSGRWRKRSRRSSSSRGCWDRPTSRGLSSTCTPRGTGGRASPVPG